MVGALLGAASVPSGVWDKPKPFSALSFRRRACVGQGRLATQRARPGITGWAQIRQAYDSSIDDVRNKVRFDLEYLERWSLWEDIRIMARTIPVIVFRRGAR